MSDIRGEHGRVIAFYLPQYHPIPENDEWWGTGFTEWRNVARAKPLFRGHHQPHVPAELGFYDLRLPEVRHAQASLAAEHGVDAFCYYHYWFGGRRLLERPFEEILKSGEPDFPFAVCWANEDWTRTWDGRGAEVLIGQRYSDEDDRQHLQALAPAFADDRYLRVDGKPLFLVYRATRLPDPRRTTDVWREEADRLGLGELFLCRVESSAGERHDPAPLGFDAAVDFQPDWSALGQPVGRRWWQRAAARAGLRPRAFLEHRVYRYDEFVDRMEARPAPPYERFPTVTPAWDNTARRQVSGVVLHDSTPERYERWLSSALASVRGRPDDHRLVFVNAWNEWAEGNHLEPDLRSGRAYLEATLRAVRGA